MGAFMDAGERLIAGATVGMYVTAREIMAESLALCPVDTGTLRGSAKIEPVETDGVSLKVRFGYGYGDEINPVTGRPAAEYAVPVHEILEAFHAAPTQAKFLEEPVMMLAPTLGPNMEASMSLAVRKHGVVVSERVEKLVFPSESPGPSVETLLPVG